MKVSLATLLLSAGLVLAACKPAAVPQAAPGTAENTSGSAASSAIAPDIPAGAYELDLAHASLLFRVSHLGFSHYTARFKRFTAQLQFDPRNQGAASLSVNIDPRSLETDFPDVAKLDFNAELLGEQWLNVAQYPDLKFNSTKVEVTGPNALRVTGDLTLHGVTKPVVLDAKFNGGYAGHPYDPRARIGFSAHGTLKRSDFGVSYGIPAPGTTMGVSDQVEVIIEAEFSGPPLKTAESPASAPAAAGEH